MGLTQACPNNCLAFFHLYYSRFILLSKILTEMLLRANSKHELASKKQVISSVSSHEPILLLLSRIESMYSKKKTRVKNKQTNKQKQKQTKKTQLYLLPSGCSLFLHGFSWVRSVHARLVTHSYQFSQCLLKIHS